MSCAGSSSSLLDDIAPTPVPSSCVTKMPQVQVGDESLCRVTAAAEAEVVSILERERKRARKQMESISAIHAAPSLEETGLRLSSGGEPSPKAPRSKQRASPHPTAPAPTELPLAAPSPEDTSLWAPTPALLELRLGLSELLRSHLFLEDAKKSAHEAEAGQKAATEALHRLGGLLQHLAQGSSDFALVRHAFLGSAVLPILIDLLSPKICLQVRLGSLAVLHRATSLFPGFSASISSTPAISFILNLIQAPSLSTDSLKLLGETLSVLVDVSPANRRSLLAADGLILLLKVTSKVLKTNQVNLAASFLNALLSSIPDAKESHIIAQLGDASNDAPFHAFKVIQHLLSDFPSLRCQVSAVVGHLAAISPNISKSIVASQSGRIFQTLLSVLDTSRQNPTTPCVKPSVTACQDDPTTSTVENLQQWILYAISSLLRDSPDNTAVFLQQAEALQLLAYFLNSQCPPLQRISAVALHRIVELASRPLLESQVIPLLFSPAVMTSIASLLRMPQSPVEEVVTQATLLLVGALPPYFSINGKLFMPSFRDAQVLSKIVLLLGSSNSAILYLACSAVSSCILQCQAVCRQLSISCPTLIPAIVRLLSHGCPNIQSIACGILCSSAAVRFESSEAIRLAGGLEKLVALIGASDIHLQCRAVGALGSCAANNGRNKKHIRDLGAIPKLVHLLKSPRSETHVLAAAALSNCMCDSPDTQAIVLRYGGIAALVDNITSPQPDLRQWSIRALMIASKDNQEVAAQIAVLGGTTALCQIALGMRTPKDALAHQTLCG